jgi:hypothetical protein
VLNCFFVRPFCVILRLISERKDTKTWRNTQSEGLCIATKHCVTNNKKSKNKENEALITFIHAVSVSIYLAERIGTSNVSGKW